MFVVDKTNEDSWREVFFSFQYKYIPYQGLFQVKSFKSYQDLYFMSCTSFFIWLVGIENFDKFGLNFK
jgi:hypothetical protein